MNPNDLIIFAIIALVVNCIILYQIILSATRSNELVRLGKIQANILILLAKKEGVSNEEIQEAIKKSEPAK